MALFQSTQGAIAAEKLLGEAGIEHRLVPVPRQISSNCGFCLRFHWKDRERVERVLGSADIGFDRIVVL